MENKETFNYTYSAKEQNEILNIRKKYEPKTKEEDKMATLRKLDESVTSKATRVSIIVGTIGTLLLGLGMSLIMTDIGANIGLNRNIEMVIGIIVGVIGMIPMGIAYPLYNRTLKKEREKIAPEIIRLTDELIK